MCRIVNRGDRCSTWSPARLGSPKAEIIPAESEMAPMRTSRTAFRPPSVTMAASHSVTKRATSNIESPAYVSTRADHLPESRRSTNSSRLPGSATRAVRIRLKSGRFQKTIGNQEEVAEGGGYKNPSYAPSPAVERLQKAPKIGHLTHWREKLAIMYPNPISPRLWGRI